MLPDPITVDVLCIGHASFDLIFSVARHPSNDEKMSANAFQHSGGGPAANAALLVSKLGLKSAYAGYLGLDAYGEQHLTELKNGNVNSTLIVRGQNPTPITTIIVKPNGQRALINFKGNTQALPVNAINFDTIKPRVILVDGHEPHLSLPLIQKAKDNNIPTVLDAGSLHNGTEMLMTAVDHLVCSQKFALQFAQTEQQAFNQLSKITTHLVITLGDQGLLWKTPEQTGALPAFPVKTIDTTGAGDAFHGAYAAGLAQQLPWLTVLRYASSAGAYCCMHMGARQGLPSKQQLENFQTLYAN